MYTYAWYHWITFFFFYCFLGWVFESVYVSLKKGRFVNRGFLRLPMLPLYGTGAVMMLWVSLPFKGNLPLVYLSGVAGATALEYVTGFVMEQLFKVKYWDYSKLKFNLHGYICLTSSIAWGFLTILMTEVIHTPVEQFVLNLNPAVEFSFLGITGVLFTADAVQSVREALNLARVLEAMTKMRGELEELQVQAALLKAEAAQHMGRIREAQQLRAAAFQSAHMLRAFKLKEGVSQKLTSLRREAGQKLPAADLSALTIRLKEVSENRQKLTQHINFYRKGILRGNPGATSRRFSEALKELRDLANRDKTA